MTLDRRNFLFGASAAAVGSMTAGKVWAEPRVWRMPREFRPRDVQLEVALEPGVIHVDTANTWLYLTLPEGRARRYKIAVGAAGRNFRGQAIIRRKAEWPSWTPTANMIRLEPSVYGPYRSGLPGGHERNPLGARALYLYQGSRDTLYRIHGTPQPWTMGQSFSSGCIRLINEHAIELYDRVPLGTRVVVR